MKIIFTSWSLPSTFSNLKAQFTFFKMDIEDLVIDGKYVAGRGCKKMRLEKGKEYYFCVCGRSKNQPFCDGSHRRLKTGQKPLKFVATRETNYMCMCKQSKKLPFCDSSHRKLPPHPKVEIARRQRARRRSVLVPATTFLFGLAFTSSFFFGRAD